MNNKKILTLFIISILAGLVIWVFSSSIFGTSEPWDSPHYGLVSLILIAIGFVFGLIGYEKPLFWPLGFFLGCFLFGIFSFIKDIVFYRGGGVNMFIPLGVIFLIPFCFPVLLGAFIGSFIIKKYKKSNKTMHLT